MKTTIGLLLGAVLTLGCGAADDLDSAEDESADTTEEGASSALTPIGKLSAGEASGVVASRKYPGIMWWHRDGGAENGQPRAAVFAYKLVNGKLAELSPGVYFKAFKIAGQTNSQWEDIATDDQGNLWIGQIGSCKTCPHYLLKIAEPDPYEDTTATVLTKYPYTYPGAFKNAEALLIVDGSPYIFSKESNTSVYRMPLTSTNESKPNVLSLVGALAGPAGKISGADLSIDRRRLAIQTHMQVWVHEIPQTTATGEAFVAKAIAAPPKWHVDMSDVVLNVEGIGFVGTSYNVTLVAESKDIFYLPATFYQASPM